MSDYQIQIIMSKKVSNSDESFMLSSMLDSDVLEASKDIGTYLAYEYENMKMACDLAIEKKLRPSEWDV